jgi:hypothetical protein
LRGAAQITEFMRELLADAALKESRVFYWLSNGTIPAIKYAGTWTSSKAEIRGDLYGRIRGKTREGEPL